MFKLLKKKLGFDEGELFGEFWLFFKKLLVFWKLNVVDDGYVYFLKLDRVVDNLFKNYDIVFEFWIIGDFFVNIYIIFVLWVNMIGWKFDVKLEKSCYGVRLKCICNDDLFLGDE